MSKKKVEVVETEEIKEEKEGFHPDLVSLFIKLIILIGFIFLIIFVITNIKKNNEMTTFNKNIETMRASAYTYFKDETNRPVEENEEIDISLDDMIASKMVKELKINKKTICDKTASGIAVTKINDSKYNLDVTLNCGEKSKTENYVLNYSSLKKEASSNEKEKAESEDNSDSNNTVTTASNSNNNVSSNKETEHLTTMYELRRTIQAEASYECPEGFTLIGTKCYSNVSVLKASAVPIYDVKPAKNVKASYHREEVKYEYADAIVSSGKVTMHCPTGYSLVNNKCQKIENPYSKNKITYSCPKGYTLSGTKCKITTAPITKNATYKCNTGTLTNDNRCMVTTKATVSCKAGTYDSKKKMCYIEINASPIYSNWKVVGVINTKNEQKNTDKVAFTYLGKTSSGYYRYRKYTRTITSYSCVAGVYAGNGKCHFYHENYFKYSCKTGTLNGKNCITYTNAIKTSNASSYCPSGYSKVNNSCVITINATKNTSKVYYCKAGSVVTSTKKCMTLTEPTAKQGKDVYSCPQGYEKIGSGSATKCRKKNVTPGYYYCKDDDAVLSNDRCITAAIATFKGYKCPSGYELASNYCYKYTTSETLKATKIAGNVISEEVIWSASKRLDGWTFTGNTKKV